jgi:hypothetical protein
VAMEILLLHPNLKKLLMLWFQKNQRYCRIAFLSLLVIAISGPWWFDRIWVPSASICTAPNIRLDEDYCGIPLSITWFYSSFVAEIGSLVTDVVTNTLGPGDARSLLFIVWITVPLLPLLTTIFVLLPGDQQRGHLLHRVVLGLAAVLVGLIGIFEFSRASWVLWGLWLYLALVLSMLLLEIKVFSVHRRLIHE